MNSGFLLALITGLCWSGTGILFSRIAANGHDFIGIRVRSSTLAAIGAWLMFPRFPLGDPAPMLDAGRLAVILIPGSLMGSFGMFLLSKAMGRGHNGAAWTLSQSAMVLPFLAGIFIWHESPTAVKLSGVGCVLVSMACFGISREGKEKRGRPPTEGPQPLSWFPLALCAFLGLGCLQILMSIPSRWDGWEDPYQLRLPVLLTGMALANQLIRLFHRNRTGAKPWSYVGVGVAIALVSQRIMFTAIDQLASTGQAGLAFPVAISACVLGFSAYSLFLLREPTNRTYLAGMALGFSGIILMTWP